MCLPLIYDNAGDLDDPREHPQPARIVIALQRSFSCENAARRGLRALRTRTNLAKGRATSTARGST